MFDFTPNLNKQAARQAYTKAYNNRGFWRQQAINRINQDLMDYTYYKCNAMADNWDQIASLCFKIATSDYLLPEDITMAQVLLTNELIQDELELIVSIG